MAITINSTERAFGELFKANYSRLFYCAYDMVGDCETARDIVAEVFRMAWENYDVLSQKRIEAYLQRSVRNRSIDHHFPIITCSVQ